MEAKVFPRKIELYHFINSVTDKFDIKQSLMARENSFVTKEGKHVNSLHFAGFISNLNKELGLNFDPSASRQTPSGYVIVISDRGQVKDEPVEAKEEMEQVVEQPEQEETVENTDEGLVIQEQPLEDQTNPVVVSEGEENSIINEAMSLYDENSKKESKDKLADFALSKGVTLAKNQTFEDMIQQFKDLLVQE